jgi:hypothetical protein
MRRPWFATIVSVVGLGLIIQANSAHAKLEDILYEKGQITKEEWLKAQADAEKAVELSTKASVEGRQTARPSQLSHL